MKTQKIRKKIQKAITDEEQTGRFAQIVRETARKNGRALNPTQIAVIVETARGYIEHVPYFLEQAMSVAGQFGLQREMDQMVNEIEAYWFDPDDAIPDHLGLIGLLDDAYASLFLLQGMSDYCQNTAGRPLLKESLTHANQAIRNLIGEPIVSHLESRVGITIANAMMQAVLSQFVNVNGFAFGGGPDPIWGNASMDEIVTARLGAMGIV